MQITRRAFVAGTAATIGGGILGGTLTTNAYAAEGLTLTADGITVVGEPDGTIVIYDGGGTERLRLAHFLVKDTQLGEQRTFGGTPSAITLPDGRDAIAVDYRMGTGGAGITVRGIVDVTPHRAHLRWEATSSNEMYLNSQFHRVVVEPTADEVATPLTRWNRHAGGGVPYETNDGMVYAETWSDLAGYFRLAGSNPAWSTGVWMHIVGVYDGDVLVHDADVVLGALRAPAANTLAAGRPLGIEVWTDQPFNLWDGTGQSMTLHAQAVNGRGTDTDATVSWWVRDFDGTVVADGSEVVTVPPAGVIDRTFEVPAAAQGISFAEVRVTSGDDEAFARTTLSNLPPYAYAATGIFGISNYPWLLEPSKGDVAGLFQRIGVKSVRIAYDGAPGIPPAELERLGIMPNIQHGDVMFDADPAEIETWAAELVDVVVGSGAHYFEVDNERNQPWMSGLYADTYIRDGLRPVVDRLGKVGSTVKVMNTGLGGMDYRWTENFIAAGGWGLIDCFAFHPGRGNFTPDYAPPPEDWDAGANGEYWNFLGGLRKARQILDENGGDKELWLTEAYACTRPNYWWNDTLRHAAENVLLTMALCLSEGVDGVNWYQPHDSTIHHPQEADPDNVEYHFGLMNRDTTAKPSLLAYATGTRVLEGATFVRWLTFADEDVKGLLFDTPDGPMSILWTRKDGYILNADHDPDEPTYPHPEAWVDPWPTKTRLTLLGGRVRELDCIGRERVIRGGLVELVLDGAPRVYYGLGDQPERRVRDITT